MFGIFHFHFFSNSNFSEDSAAYSYETAIPVMESSGQDVLELEMNRSMGTVSLL